MVFPEPDTIHKARVCDGDQVLYLDSSPIKTPEKRTFLNREAFKKKNYYVLLWLVTADILFIKYT